MKKQAGPGYLDNQCCGTRTGTVTNYGSGTGTRLCICLPLFKFFPITFYNNFVEIYEFFPCKQLTIEKVKKNFKNILEKLCFLWSRYEAGTGTLVDT